MKVWGFYYRAMYRWFKMGYGWLNFISRLIFRPISFYLGALRATDTVDQGSPNLLSEGHVS